MAFTCREVVAGGLIRHVDRGVQYACAEHVAVLERHGIQSSTSGAAYPYDNAMARRSMSALKQEEVVGHTCRDLAEAMASTGRFIEDVYDGQRLHRALGDLPLAVFETSTPSSRAAAQARSMMKATNCP